MEKTIMLFQVARLHYLDIDYVRPWIVEIANMIEGCQAVKVYSIKTKIPENVNKFFGGSKDVEVTKYQYMATMKCKDEKTLETFEIAIKAFLKGWKFARN